MIDTIYLRIPYVINDTSKFETKKTADNDGVHLTTKWMLGNLGITINHITKETYIQGSIKKYALGDGALDDLLFGDLQLALASIREQLGIPAHIFVQASILRLDMGMTIETLNPVSAYIDAIQSKSRIDKDKFSDDSVQFAGTNKKIIFYNKYKERRAGGVKPKDITIKGKKVAHDRWLRFEVQWKKPSGLKKQLFGIKYLVEIFDNYSRLLDKLINEFDTITFSKTSTLEVISHPKNSSDAMAIALVIAAKSDSSAVEMIDSLCKQGLMNKNQATYCRKKIRECSKNFKVSNQDKRDELLQEIESRVKSAYYFYKSDKALYESGGKMKIKVEPTEELPSDLGIQVELDPGNLLPRP